MIVSALSGKKFKVEITYPASDPEAMMFANDIGSTLRDAGLELSARAFLDTAPVFGLGISQVADGQVPGPEWIALADAFKNAGWTFGLAEVHEQLTIIVGSKKPPF
jgi:hypothetical protein